MIYYNRLKWQGPLFLSPLAGFCFAPGRGDAMSETRKVYIGRLIGRCVIFVICLFMYLFRRDFFTVLNGMNFFKEFSLLHLLWGVWVVDMILQIIPIKNEGLWDRRSFFPVASNPYGKRSITRRCETTSYPPQKRPIRCLFYGVCSLLESACCISLVSLTK